MDAVKVLIVDDSKVHRRFLYEVAQELGYESSLAENGLAALAQVDQNPPDLILLDIMMPVMDGFQVLERLKNDPALVHIPVIVISANRAIQGVLRCIDSGAEDYLSKPFQPNILKARIKNCIKRKQLRDSEQLLQEKISQYNQLLTEKVKEQVSFLAQAHLSTIFALSKLAESRNPETSEHLERMREYCRTLALELSSTRKYRLKIDHDFIDNIYLASPLYDVGKVGIADNILLKPDNLTEEEFEIMKTHTTIGADTLRAVSEKYSNNGFLRMAIEIAESHHECWAGNGYPGNLKKEEIPLAGRIMAVADTYDALVSKRVYKEAYSQARSRQIIINEGGTHFDPDIVEAFLACEEKFQKIRQDHAEIG